MDSSPITKRPVVFISSTVLDLAAYRLAAEAACRSLGMFHLVMEYRSAIDRSKVLGSLAMVQEANVYFGIGLAGTKFGKGALSGVVDCSKEVVFAFLGLHFSKVDAQAANEIVLKLQTSFWAASALPR